MHFLTYESLFLFILICLFNAYGRIFFILSSLLIILLASGNSLFKWMASNSHFVVHTPQPMQRLKSTTEAPQLKHLSTSTFNCSSVSGSLVSSNIVLGSIPIL